MAELEARGVKRGSTEDEGEPSSSTSQRPALVEEPAASMPVDMVMEIDEETPELPWEEHYDANTGLLLDPTQVHEAEQLEIKTFELSLK